MFPILLCGASGVAVVFIVNELVGSLDLMPVLVMGMRVCVRATYTLGYFANTVFFPTEVKASIFAFTMSIGLPFSALSAMVTEYTEHPAEILLVSSLMCMGVFSYLPKKDKSEQDLSRIKFEIEQSKKLLADNSQDDTLTQTNASPP